MTNIHVFEPIAYDSVGSPFTIRGEARVFENIVHYRLKDGDGNILAQNTTEAQSSDVGTYGSFAFAVSYVTNRNLSLELEIFTLSAKDGSEIEKITIPLTAKF